MVSDQLRSFKFESHNGLMAHVISFDLKDFLPWKSNMKLWRPFKVFGLSRVFIRKRPYEWVVFKYIYNVIVIALLDIL